MTLEIKKIFGDIWGMSALVMWLAAAVFFLIELIKFKYFLLGTLSAVFTIMGILVIVGMASFVIIIVLLALNKVSKKLFIILAFIPVLIVIVNIILWIIALAFPNIWFYYVLIGTSVLTPVFAFLVKE
ncbi:MAG: hypothetical protein KAU62_18355 [Candidatus Heimdallarchaeota archaeon]|nr:hypothetical protein [Candidatus Heimdallarchaeota archaeon]MCG3258076.1 hypothetical protein [Candidatus Heimdallarchaeota archaeon]MCK4613126.1 hypothetical protein [Candidatus Heimdallarchaeota archaeon]